ncbi:hypothetical protein U8335_03940 [Roseiconus lacunae]|uniref:hypothetical protein n=1 Tax=Roseiconus lacunae TaxID=2605694 RepID=UPI00308CD622|nr:hypothetical protein U8335_03940 [Stieleria sp. HD01]
MPADIVELFEKRRKYLNAGRVNYQRADKIVDQLLERCAAGVSVTLPPATKRGKPEVHTLVDQFADTNKVWAGSSCSRYKIESRSLTPQEIAAQNPTPADEETGGDETDGQTAGG